MIGAVVLAAGAGARFGGVKVVAPLDGVPLVRQVVQRLLDAGIGPVVVTVGTHAATIEQALDGLPVRCVPVAEGTEMSGSLRAGVEALPAACDAWLVALGDVPRIDPAVIARLITAWQGSNAAAVVPIYRDGVPGHPVLFDATLRRKLGELTGDRGAQGLLRALGDRVASLAIDAPAPADVDTPEDLRTLGA